MSAIALFGVLVLVSTLRVQWVEGAHWKALSDSLTTRTREIPATRGSIFSDDGNLLATSIPKYKISLDFDVIRNYHSDSFNRYVPFFARELHRRFGHHTEAEYKKILSDNYRERSRYVVLEKNASFIDLKEIKQWPVFRSGRFKGGLIAEERTIRKNPYGGMLARTIGYVNENGVGAGLEASYQDQLAGTNGEVVVQRISGGYEPVADGLIIEPKDGMDIFTTINVEIQDISHTALLRALERHQADFGCAIVMEVSTGKIKALVNLSRTPSGTYSETYNHAIGRNIEPGSTMKLISALALLNDNKIGLEDSVDINNGRYQFYDRWIEDSEKGTHQKLTFREVFEKSSNVGVARSVFEAYKDDPDDFIEYYQNLFEGKDLNIHLKGAARPIWLTPKDSLWSGLTLVSTSIGYSVRMSPIHILSLYNAIANDGKMMRPLLVTGYGKMGAIEENFEPQVVSSSICSASTLKMLQGLLVGVVNEGTARNLKDLPFQVAGKTGTARMPKGSEGYYKDRYNASFAGYFPAEKPEYSCYVLVNRPRSGAYYGSSVAAPVFKEIARQIYAQKIRVPVDSLPAYTDEFSVKGFGNDIEMIQDQLDLRAKHIPRSAKKAEWQQLIKHGDTVRINALSPQKNIIPDLTNMGIRDAIYLLENMGYIVRFRGVGKVAEQSPKAGESLQPGQTIYLRLE